MKDPTPFTDFCNAVCAQVRFRPDRAAILSELWDHLEDHADALKERGIPTNLYYPTPMHMLPVFRALETYGETYPNAVEYCNRTISIPMHPYLETAEQQQIIDAVLEAIR